MSFHRDETGRIVARNEEDTRAHLLANCKAVHGGCWEWRRGNNGRYGTVCWEGRKTYAHRMAHICFNGPIPAGHDVCHECDNPICINPQHLFTGTRQQNMDDAKHKNRMSRVAKIFGAKHPRARIDEADVRMVRSEHKGQYGDGVRLAKILGVHPRIITGIVRGYSWRHVA